MLGGLIYQSLAKERSMVKIACTILGRLGHSYGGDCRKALATPGLLIIHIFNILYSIPIYYKAVQFENSKMRVTLSFAMTHLSYLKYAAKSYMLTTFPTGKIANGIKD